VDPGSDGCSPGRVARMPAAGRHPRERPEQPGIATARSARTNPRFARFQVAMGRELDPAWPRSLFPVCDERADGGRWHPGRGCEPFDTTTGGVTHARTLARTHAPGDECAPVSARKRRRSVRCWRVRLQTCDRSDGFATRHVACRYRESARPSLGSASSCLTCSSVWTPSYLLVCSDERTAIAKNKKKKLHVNIRQTGSALRRRRRVAAPGPTLHTQ
jgi:hypothetical protein